MTQGQEHVIQFRPRGAAGKAVDPTPLGLDDIEQELARFERDERKRLGLVEEVLQHWTDPNPQRFTRAQRESTTILIGGLTRMQDYFIQGAWRGLGYRVTVLDVPDNEALRYGREFGNRGQCNPTYFTVGNLVKYLCKLRDEQGKTTREIIDGYVFLTAGACGPCRFGTYATEYRKALRDAGFEGFRVRLFQQQGGLAQGSGDDEGLDMSPKFFILLLQGLIAGDILNAIGYRLRPYEVVPGSTDAALERCRETVHDAMASQHSMLRALWRCRRTLRAVKVDRRMPKPKVSIIGEFWAMTTEGDGNHRLQRFLEAEGAEVDTQVVTAWLLYNIWAVRWDTLRRLELRGVDAASQGLAGANPRKRLRLLKLAEAGLRGVFGLYARIVGLRHYHLPDMNVLAALGHEHYDNHLRGGEGHMEVAKLIQSVQERKHHMVISVKPFGCMPSSGVSDGIQSLVTERYPDAIFCAIETTGDGAANVQSRVLMDLFKARVRAREEYAAVLGSLKPGPFGRLWRRRALHDPLWYPSIAGVAGTAARSALHSGANA
jgi:predicted nucleotide-binding protein (sugar kinase/HSP70/actin superfamily)